MGIDPYCKAWRENIDKVKDMGLTGKKATVKFYSLMIDSKHVNHEIKKWYKLFLDGQLYDGDLLSGV